MIADIPTKQKRAKYDDIFIYLIPGILSSFNRAKEESGAFTEKLNTLFQYDLFIVGMREKQKFTYYVKDIAVRNHGTITLEKLQPQCSIKLWANTLGAKPERSFTMILTITFSDIKINKENSTTKL